MRLALALAVLLAPAAASAAWINEIHYDNASTDSGEAIEIAGAAGQNLDSWRLVLYNGNGGASYGTINLTGSVPNSCSGFGVRSFAAPGLQNGSPDGIALVDASDTVVQFLSYEGPFTATDGPAAGMLSVDIGVSEPDTTPAGQSLQLTGFGSEYADFDWQPPATSSFGACNPGQTFDGVDTAPTVVTMSPADAESSVPASTGITVSFDEPVDLDVGAITLTCSLSGAIPLVLEDVFEDGTTYAAQPPHLISTEQCTTTVTASLVTDRDGVVNEMLADESATWTVEPDGPPAVVSTSGTGDQPPHNTVLFVQFDEPVDVTGSWWTLECISGGPAALNITGGPILFTARPAADLDGLDSCNVTIHAALVTDRDLSIDPMSADVTWSFNTTQDLTDYYAAVDTTNSTTLRATLHATIRGHMRYPYTSGSTDTWDILEIADEDPANPSRILDIYRNASYAKAGGGNTDYNREHTWPKSYGFPDDVSGNYPYTDTHHLMLSDSGYNSSRGNKPFDDCTAACNEYVTVENNGVGGGSGSFPGWSSWADSTFWQVWTARKGNIARALLYMDVRYEGGAHPVTGHLEPDLVLTDNASLIQTSGSNTAGVAYMGLLTTLLDWHEADPVDAQEQLRNEVIYSFQNNRNPFIDHPEWAACVFENACDDLDRIFGSGFE
jgi:endonuclease I